MSVRTTRKRIGRVPRRGQVSAVRVGGRAAPTARPCRPLRHRRWPGGHRNGPRLRLGALGRTAVEGEPVGYLYRVAQSSVRRRRWRPVYERPDASEPWVEPKLPAALASLSPHQRVVVMLVHGFGWTHAEAAELLGITRSSVQQHLERALASLRHEIGVGTDE